jgi:hypothetical protein
MQSNGILNPTIICAILRCRATGGFQERVVESLGALSTSEDHSFIVLDIVKNEHIEFDLRTCAARCSLRLISMRQKSGSWTAYRAAPDGFIPEPLFSGVHGKKRLRRQVRCSTRQPGGEFFRDWWEWQVRLQVAQQSAAPQTPAQPYPLAARG